MVHGTEDGGGPGIDLGVPGCTDAVPVGRGGFGVVYRAWQPDFHRWVAVKVIAADWAGPSRTRFERELRMLGRLSDHPHIVTLHQAGRTAAGNPYLLMAYEDGGSLADRLAAPPAVPDGETAPPGWVDAVAGGVAVAGALETAHRAGVLHRDVKPGNILVSRYGEPKLADFGLARSRAEVPEGGRRRITASVPYTAPEVLRGEPASVASDVYALAATVLHWIRGERAFTGDSEPELLRRIAAEPVPDLRPDGVPEAVCAAVERAMAKSPADRQPSVAAFAGELRHAQRAAGHPVTPFVLGTETTAALGEPGPAGDGGTGTTGDADPGTTGDSEPRAAGDDDPTVTATVGRPTRRRVPALVRAVGLLLAGVSVLAVAGSAVTAPADRLTVPVEVAIGEYDLYASSEETTVAVQNTGRREVRLHGVATDGPHGDDLRLTGEECTGRMLSPGQHCEIRMIFSPREVGARNPLLSVTVVGRTLPLTVQVTGAGRLRPASSDDAPPGRCYDDAHQVGPSAYGYSGGLRGLSVKQFWSPQCGATMAYVWVWQQYRDTAMPGGGTWTIDLAGRPTDGGDGVLQQAHGQAHELWTLPLDLGAGVDCTVATATVTHSVTGESMTATTDPFCG
ncbi:serine/threonine-protein kinase [Micromonospora sp. NPDC000207]|uniref:serine/threonine-protein kinase n=1 Tax=Micromonospora sp. NPDC000207 TaxID=3154246 RepID=UPI0033306309